MSQGSVFRKWDLHVHTPCSFENQYCFDNSEEQERYNDNLWDKYIDELERLPDIAVIGITDYFCIDGYRKVLEYRSQGRLSNIQNILPNIEFRLDNIVGDKRINYHVIFSENADPDDIENEFLQSLLIMTPNGEKVSLRRSNIEDIGKKLKEQHAKFRDRSDYYIGCTNITVSLEDIMKPLRDKASIFNKNYMLILAEPNLELMNWDKQDHLVRKFLTWNSHALFSPNEKTRLWGLGKEKSYKTQQDFISEFGSLKPCIHGSDSHGFDAFCKPDLDRFCWIKADTTFEGLSKSCLNQETEFIFAVKILPVRRISTR